MTTDADEIGPPSEPPPGVLAYLKSVFELGRRSLRPALPALAFLFAYKVGLGAYGSLTNYAYSRGSGALGVRWVHEAVFILILAFIYIPFLPLQESILRGRPSNFLEAIRSVLRVPVKLTISVIAQVVILLAPVAPMTVVGAHLLSDPFGPILWAGMAWLAIAAFFMVFAVPAVVLDGEGPLGSLRTSFLLVWRNRGIALGRFLVLACLAFVATMVPLQFMNRGPAAPVLIKLAAATFSSAFDTLLYPFWVAAIVVLYRSLRPWEDEGGA